MAAASARWRRSRFIQALGTIRSAPKSMRGARTLSKTDVIPAMTGLSLSSTDRLITTDGGPVPTLRRA